MEDRALKKERKGEKMNQTELVNVLRAREKMLTDALIKLEKERAREPDGRVRVTRRGCDIEFYHVRSDDNKYGKYLNKKELPLAKALLQKDYNRKVEIKIRAELSSIQALLDKMSFDSPEQVYISMSKERQNLVTPMFLTDKEYAERWTSEAYEQNPFHPEEKVYETERGEFVRSKSEKDIANLYFEMGIPYRYEAAVFFKNGKIKYPDFTVLDVAKRRIIYHEHLGLLDKEEYRIDALQKIDLYRENGIYTGNNLIITHEAKYSPFNIKTFRKSVKTIFDR